MIDLKENQPIADVKYILTDQHVWANSSEDGMDVETFNPVDNESINYLGIYSSPKRLIGVIVTHPDGLTTVKVHIAILKPYRGLYAVAAGKALIKWFAALPDRVQKLNADIPEYNTGAISLARECGLTSEGINRKSIMRDGVLYDQLRYGVTKQEAKTLCQAH